MLEREFTRVTYYQSVPLSVKSGEVNTIVMAKNKRDRTPRNLGSILKVHGGFEVRMTDEEGVNWIPDANVRAAKFIEKKRVDVIAEKILKQTSAAMPESKKRPYVRPTPTVFKKTEAKAQTTPEKNLYPHQLEPTMSTLRTTLKALNVKLPINAKKKELVALLNKKKSLAK
jgi:hypothetical protein